MCSAPFNLKSNVPSSARTVFFQTAPAAVIILPGGEQSGGRKVMANLRAIQPAELNLLSAAEAAARIAAGDITSEELVADCLARIEARDGALHAWAFVDPDLALAQARACDAADAPLGPLHGVPVGIKDVLDTKDMPTEYGSEIYRGYRPAADSACVAALRRSGAVLLGKTTTTQFASPIPVGVRNPHDTDRTPGVSSSGSAAAVADFMVPLANGTQTGGSVILPAAFCGVVGYKASLDGLDRGGIAGLKLSLDTLGLFARAVEDIALVYTAVTGDPVRASGRPRIGLCRTPMWDEAEPCAQQALERAGAALSEAGYDVDDIDLPPPLHGIEGPFRVISNYEGKRALASEFRDNMDQMNDWMRETGESNWSHDDYAKALAAAEDARGAMSALYDDYPVLLTPSTAGEAPADLVSPTMSSFNRMWTLMHGPTITLPVATGPAGMPVGVQLAARPGDDAALIARAAGIFEILAETMA
jgi:Asp-tRNA(Asn)/Glu-tRNA(Gln) amidotransferase A subunit family amidase